MLNHQEAKNKIVELQNSITKDDNNIAIVIGIMDEESIMKEGIIETKVNYTSPKGIIDDIPVKMSSTFEIQPGKKYLIFGESRSESEGFGFIERYLWVNDIIEVSEDAEDYNFLYLKGKICKKIKLVYVGSKSVTSAVIQVEDCKKEISYYIPIVAWHVKAFVLNKAEIGQTITLNGWIQSKAYVKNEKIRHSYEVSADILKIKN